MIERSFEQNGFTILFCQVGNDPEVIEYLRQLDDDLVKTFGTKFDLFDARTTDRVDGKSPHKVALEALQD